MFECYFCGLTANANDHTFDTWTASVWLKDKKEVGPICPECRAMRVRVSTWDEELEAIN